MKNKFLSLIRSASVVCLLAQISVFGQTTNIKKTVVGDPIVSGLFIKPYKNLWKLTYTKPTGESIEAATWSDEVEEVWVDSRRLFKRTQVTKYLNGGYSTLINVFDANTFAPVSRDFRRKNGMFNHIDFAPGSISFQRAAAPGIDINKGTVKLDAPVYDFYGGLYGLLIAGFPLETGFSATFLSLDESTDNTRPATFKAIREEMVDAGPGKQVKAWVVECEDDGMMTFWLTKSAPYVIKLVYVDRKGLRSTYAMM